MVPKTIQRPESNASRNRDIYFIIAALRTHIARPETSYARRAGLVSSNVNLRSDGLRQLKAMAHLEALLDLPAPERLTFQSTAGLVWVVTK